MTIILGALRVIWLQGLSAGFALLSPTIKAAIGGSIAIGLAVTVYALWPSAGNPIGEAILDAVGTRETITKLNVDEEKHDNAWLEEWEKNTAAGRDAAARVAADRVIWRADDAWLRGKRAAKGR